MYIVYVHDGDMTVRVHRLYHIKRTVLAYNRQLKYTEHTDRSFIRRVDY